ncbi:MAG TPA: RNA methyltransferase [Acidimicrobiales bacterium]|nr:RNA methyltransferase [Acidimicrobiales bacterium]
MSRRSAREADRVFVAEGAKVLGEALASGASVEAVFVAPEGRGATEDAVIALAYERGARVHDLAPGVLERVAGTVTPQPVLGIVSYVDVELSTLRASADGAFVVICVDVRDPGNAGTVLRSAEAAGAAGVICCAGTVDVYNPKTVRASAGSLFHVPVVTGGSPVEVLDEVASWGVRRLATVAHDGSPYDEIDLTGPVAFVLGNEANGLPDGLDAHIDEAVTIPMIGRTESLNVGMAAAVLCFEAARQRRAA